MVAGAAGIFVILGATRPEPEVAAIEETRFSVHTIAVEPRSIHPELRLIATVESAAQPTLTAALSADVMQVHAFEGQAVPRGELLLELDARDAEVQFAQAQAELAQAEANLRLETSQGRANAENLAREKELARLSESELARLVQLREKGLVSENSLNTAKQNHQRALQSLATRSQAVDLQPARIQQARARLAAAEAALQAAELQLERTRIHAPFDAIITAVSVDTGARVAPGQALISLYDATRVEFEVDLPSRYLEVLREAIAQGQPIAASSAFAGTDLSLHLQRLGGESRGGAVQGWFAAESALGIPVGLRLPLNVQLPAQASAVVVPESGLYDLSRVFVVRDGRLQSLTVEVLGRQNNDVVVRHPEIRPGEHILVTHLANAVSGLAVTELE